MTRDELWPQFYFHLQAKRRQKNTLRFYQTTQTVFRRFLKSQGMPADG